MGKQARVMGSSANPEEVLVSSRTMDRLQAAEEAIKQTKAAMPDGSGNQTQDLYDSQFKSNHRWRVTRQPGYWDYDESTPVKSRAAQELAGRYPDALRAAKVDMAGGGGCNENGAYAFDILRRKLPKEHVQRVSTPRLDHTFVIIGDLTVGKKGPHEPDEALVVADPWPTDPRACIWTDHFAYVGNRNDITTHRHAKGDTYDARAKIAESLVMKPEAQEVLSRGPSSREEIKKFIDEDDSEHLIWTHPHAMSSPELHQNRVYREDPSR